jgi:hypothetical protein
MADLLTHIQDRANDLLVRRGQLGCTDSDCPSKWWQPRRRRRLVRRKRRHDQHQSRRPWSVSPEGSPEAHHHCHYGRLDHRSEWLDEYHLLAYRVLGDQRPGHGPRPHLQREDRVATAPPIALHRRSERPAARVHRGSPRRRDARRHRQMNARDDPSRQIDPGRASGGRTIPPERSWRRNVGTGHDRPVDRSMPDSSHASPLTEDFHAWPVADVVGRGSKGAQGAALTRVGRARTQLIGWVRPICELRRGPRDTSSGFSNLLLLSERAVETRSATRHMVVAGQRTG